MIEEVRIGDLLIQWSAARDQGKELSVEELCADSPALAVEVAARIRSLVAMDWLLDDTDEPADETLRAPPNLAELAKRAGAAPLGDTSLTLKEFADALVLSGLKDESQAAALDAEHGPESAGEFASALVRSDQLTPYQARVLLAESDQPLLLDQYEILGRLDSGGMGVVYRARHRSMNRVVALKTLPTGAVDSPEKRRRFQREVNASAKLQHPNIVTTHDAREAGGTHFLVMEYVDGRDLSKVVAMHGPLPVGKAVDFILQAVRGLEHAHGQNVIHRDIKPGNLMLDRRGAVKVLDLGLARIEPAPGEQDAPASRELTETGAVMGTAAYMAPEQALDTKAADHRSDIYSLGCTLFFLLTGRALFSAETMMLTIMAHQQRPTPCLADVRDDVPPPLDEVFQRMLAKQPAARFQSMTELAAALEACHISDDTPPLNLDKPRLDHSVGETMAAATTSRVLVQRRRRALGRLSPVRIAAIVLMGFLLVGGVWLLSFVVQLRTRWGSVAVKFSESSQEGRALDSADASNAQPAGAPPRPAAANALSFDGRDDYVEIPSLRYDGTHPITIECICSPGEPTGESMMIVTDASDLRGVTLLVNRENEVAFGPRGHRVATSQAPLAAGEWVHLAGVYTADEIRLYVDGKLADSQPIEHAFHFAASTMPLTIGAGPDGGGGFKDLLHGQIRALLISSDVRYAEDFSPPDRFDADEHTLALYHFDSGKGGRMVDSSGHDHHGKIQGAEWIGALDAERMVAE